MTTGEKLIQLRGNRPLIYVAAVIGINPSSLRMYESDKKLPRENERVKLAMFYQTSIDYLFPTVPLQ